MSTLIFLSNGSEWSSYLSKSVTVEFISCGYYVSMQALFCYGVVMATDTLASIASSMFLTTGSDHSHPNYLITPSWINPALGRRACWWCGCAGGYAACGDVPAVQRLRPQDGDCLYARRHADSVRSHSDDAQGLRQPRGPPSAVPQVRRSIERPHQLPGVRPVRRQSVR